ncbi:hypothetical protein I3271_00930 [Photobacterium leiognathi]|uniref:hypothetical protein n=1 Tax=Photobacterium leiognathi TaxID=553611 RepID=UPI001EDF5D7D|nr:hypothetical protein [Photobacterium leiognathi]MCG3883246.1 hypothetical protein [Photobacterium leiognathi]
MSILNANVTGGNDKADVWCIYNMYTHKLVEATTDVKEFCDQNGLGSNAHFHIYKTNQIDPKKGKTYLSTYKGYFIRRRDDLAPKSEGYIPFPPKVLRKPEFLNIYVYGSNDLIEKIAFKDLKQWLADNGFSTSGVAPMMATYKLDAEKKFTRLQYKGMFARPVYGEMADDEAENYDVIPFPPSERPEEMRNRQYWAVFNDSLDLVEVTNNVSSFLENKMNCLPENGKTLYATNHVQTRGNEQEPRPIVDFFRGHCVRLADDVKNGTSIALPKPVGDNALVGGRDLLVWDENERERGVVKALVVPAYQKTFKLDSLDKDALYKIADSFMNNPVERLDERYGAVYLSDVQQEDVSEVLAAMEVKLP